MAISIEVANNYRVVPKEGQSGDTLELYTDSSNLEQLQLELELILARPVQIIERSESYINEQLAKNFRASGAGVRKLSSSDSFLDVILGEALQLKSSDIHIEPNQSGGVVRLRVDGKLISRFSIIGSDYLSIVNTIKVRSNLDISEKRLPQDGRMSIDSETDVRVSTLPLLNGEKVVLRLLQKNNLAGVLSELGMTSNQMKSFLNEIKKSQGIVLISGPTGSGKTTTLYATLSEIKRPDLNIVTVEDPVEYVMDGISQVQLNEKIGLDFPRSLRTLLRQDPDIIMVGEIRDSATAQIAIRASLTGHLVLSTIHTNSAIETIARLEDMGIPRYLISSALSISIAQRLVRKVCLSCAKEVFDEESTVPNIEKRRVEAVGCHECHYTGYKGRVAIYEVVAMSNEVWKAIDSEADVESVYKGLGISSLKDQAIELVNSGETTLEEVIPFIV